MDKKLELEEYQLLMKKLQQERDTSWYEWLKGAFERSNEREKNGQENRKG